MVIIVTLVSRVPQVTQTLSMLVQNASDLETNVVSAERILEYTEVPPEVGALNGYCLIKWCHFRMMNIEDLDPENPALVSTTRGGE